MQEKGRKPTNDGAKRKGNPRGRRPRRPIGNVGLAYLEAVEQKKANDAAKRRAAAQAMAKVARAGKAPE